MTVAQLFHLLKRLPPDYEVFVKDTDEDTHKEVEAARIRGLGLTLYTGEYIEHNGGEDEHHDY